MRKISLKSDIINDEYTEYIYNTFDIQDQNNTAVEINVDPIFKINEKPWNIGLVYGNSGSGKTSILNLMGVQDRSKPCFKKDKSLISNFDWLTPKDATFLLTSMGLSSVPTWLRPFDKLSNGEQYRAELAWYVGREGDEVILIDEFTSVVDRDVAKAMSFALQKYVRRNNKKIIIASCHMDIIEWLTPCWSYSPQKGGDLERPSYRLGSRPKVELTISRTESNTWDFFKKHHYLTEKVNKSCKFFLFEWNNKPVGIVAAINQPRKGNARGMGLSRTVVNPDFQGIGLGVAISEFTAAILSAEERDLYTKTISPALGEYRNKSEKWIGTSFNGKAKKLTDEGGKYINRKARASYCHRYIGEVIHGYEDILYPIADMRKKKKLIEKTREAENVE